MPLTYNDKGLRVNINGNLSSEFADKQIISNLRFRFKDGVDRLSDEDLLNEYDSFALSEMFGDNDERFLEWIGS